MHGGLIIRHAQAPGHHGQLDAAPHRERPLRAGDRAARRQWLFRTGRLSEAPPEEIAGLLRDLCEMLADVEEKFADAGRAVEAIKRDLFATIAEAARARAGG